MRPQAGQNWPHSHLYWHTERHCWDVSPVGQSLASDFWFGETSPRLHVHDHHQVYDRLSWIGASAGDDQRASAVCETFKIVPG
jgi:hypothetical protein